MENRALADWREEIAAFVGGPGRRFGEEIEQSGRVPDEARRALRERGYLRLTAPRAYGGMGMPFTDYLELLALFSRMHGSLRVMAHVANGIWRSVDRRADEEQRERFVKPLVRGEHTVTFTLTEPNSGSGTDIRTVARRDGGEYIVNGEKWMIVFADTADYFLLFGRLEGTAGGEGTLALLVPRAAPGLEIRPMAPAMGVAGTVCGHLALRDCRVPAANRLGAEGDGLDVAFAGFLDPSRIAVGMTCVGLAERALELSIARARARVTFGRALAERQTIRMRLAEMAVDIASARELCLHAAREFDAGKPVGTLAAMAKLHGTGMLQRVTDLALQIHGGGGYVRGGEIERIYRDARMQRFEEGTAEIQKMVIAREYLARA